jgi:N-acyl-D-amino-acid deacylase
MCAPMGADDTRASFRLSSRAMNHLARIAGLSLLLLTAACGGGGSSDDGGTPAPAPSSRITTPTFFPAGTAIPATGPDVPNVAALDALVGDMIRKWNLPGVTFALARDGRLLVARGYGYQDYEARQLMQPDTMIRVASVSKFITSLAIMRLRDRGQLDLDQPFMNILTEYSVASGGDPRLRNITLRHLLQHSGGWNRTLFEDWTNQPFVVSRALGIPTPPICPDVIRYAMTQPLQFDPGTQTHYSNLGYCILGRVIARVSGQTYESYVRDQVLAPLGVHAMSIQRPRASGRGPFEAKYYIFDGAQLADSVFPGEGKQPPAYAYEPMTHEAGGGWLGSSIDLTRVMLAFAESPANGFVSADSRARMLADPHLPGDFASDDGGTGDRWRGLGPAVGPSLESFGHGGLGGGSQSQLYHVSSGYSFAVLTNGRAEDYGALHSDMFQLGLRAIEAGVTGTSTDFFPSYPSPSLPGRDP